MSAATIERPLMDAGQVGKILGKSRKVVLRMARDQEIGCVPENARSIKFTQGHVDEWIAKHEVPAKATPPAKKPARKPRTSK